MTPHRTVNPACEQASRRERELGARPGNTGSGPGLPGQTPVLRGGTSRARPRASRYRLPMHDPLTTPRLLAVARGEEEPDVVIAGARVFGAFTREWLEGDVAIADGRFAGVGSYEGGERIDGSGHWLARRVHRRAHARRVVEADGRRAGAGARCARDDHDRVRPARARERARAGGRALVHRLLRGPAARRARVGAGVRAGVGRSSRRARRSRSTTRRGSSRASGCSDWPR